MQLLSWVVFRYTTSKTLLCRLLVLTTQYLVTIDPSNGHITSKYLVSHIGLVSWDKQSDHLFRIVFKNRYTMVLVSDDRFQVIKTIVGIARKTPASVFQDEDGMQYEDDTPAFVPDELDCECEFLVECVEAPSSPPRREVISLGTRSILHFTTPAHRVIREASYTSVERLRFPDSSSQYLVIVYAADPQMEHHYRVAERDIVKLAALLQGRVHFHHFILESSLDSVNIADFDEAPPSPRVITRRTPDITQRMTPENRATAVVKDIIRRPTPENSSGNNSANNSNSNIIASSSNYSNSNTFGNNNNNMLSPTRSRSKSATKRVNIETEMGKMKIVPRVQDDMDLLKSVPSFKAISGGTIDSDYLDPQSDLILAVMRGSWLLKYNRKGRGKPHKRFFTMNAVTAIVSWSSTEDSEKSKTALVTNVLVGKPTGTTKKEVDFSFSLVTPKRNIDVVAQTANDFTTWTEGVLLALKLVKESYGPAGSPT